MSAIYLYAEVLQNIRQVTLYASLKTTQNESTKIDISSDRRIITVSHDAETANLLLPTWISGTAEVKLPIQKVKDVSVRLQIEERIVQRSEEIPEDVPWCASALKPDSRLRCRACKLNITGHDVLFNWKDLPSENWAEMMEFWHCHRPHDEAHEDGEIDGSAAVKGYGSFNRVEAVPGTAFVDSSNFLMTAADCPGTKVTALTLPNGHFEIHCSNCENLIGFEERQTNGLRLYKWSLDLCTRSKPPSQWQSFPLSNFISALLLSLIDSQIVRKFVVHAGGHLGSSQGLLIWVFNPLLQYTTSRRSSDTSFRAMKVFYQSLEDPQKTLDEHSMSLEELFLPAKTLGDLRELLRNSTEMLPVPARRFQDWDVGLLDRFGG